MIVWYIPLYDSTVYPAVSYFCISRHLIDQTSFSYDCRCSSQDGDRYREADVRLLPGSHIQNMLPQGTTVKALLQPPKHTALSQARMVGHESVVRISSRVGIIITAGRSTEFMYLSKSTSRLIKKLLK